MTSELDLKKLLEEYEAQDQEHDDLEEVESGDWEQEHKDQYRTDVYRHKPTGRFVAITQNRRGCYWSDWDYGDPDIYEVVPEVVTVTRYVPVPKAPASAVPAAPAPSAHTPQ